MFRLEDLTLFVRAAALNSFSDAAREVGVQLLRSVQLSSDWSLRWLSACSPAPRAAYA